MNELRMADSNLYVAFSYFDHDVVDWNNPNYFREITPLLVVDIFRLVKDFDLLLEELTEILDKWTPELIMKFVNSTGMLWYDSDEDETIREIITILVKEIRDYKASLSEYNKIPEKK